MSNETTSLFPEVESFAVVAFATNRHLKLHANDAHDWLLEVTYVGPGESCGLSRQTSLTSKQAACMMALFIAADGMEELEQACYDALASVSFGPKDFNPIP